MSVDETLASGVWLTDRVDLIDHRFRLVEMRIPMDPHLARQGYEHSYIGRSVVHRIRRFAAAFLQAMQDITHAHAARIQRTATAAEEELPRG